MTPHPERTILVCDDEVDITRLLEALLAFDGYRVHSVHRADRLVEDVRQQGADLVILDLMLPGTPGLQALRTLRAAGGPLGSLPVIVLTAKRLGPEERAEIRGLGAAILEKPFRVDDLLQRVRHCLSASGRPHRAGVGSEAET